MPEDDATISSLTPGDKKDPPPPPPPPPVFLFAAASLGIAGAVFTIKTIYEFATAAG